MSDNAKRRFLTVAVVVAALGIVGWTTRILGREAVPRPTIAVHGIAGDVLSPALSSESLRRFLTTQEAVRGFREVAPMPLPPDQPNAEYHAVLALPSDQATISVSAGAAGVVVARFDARADYAPFGLTQGWNNLWIDAKGPVQNPWRGIMISADGQTRTLLPDFKYTSNADHSNLGGPLQHARLYCHGQQGCLFFDASARESIWVRCSTGCCQVNGSCRPPCAKKAVQ